MTNPIIPEAALQQHIAVLGKTRSGKSSVMRGLVEGLLEREQPVCIVDPKGDWWGIKLGRDGKRAGYPVVIFGGEHADVPINEHAGAHVAELFATGNRPCLIDLGGWMVGARTRFWIDFASTLFKLTKGIRWLAVDEIHNFAPKGKIMDPDAGKALHWTNRLASEGLGKGLPMLFASQRPQKVHNDTLTSAETLIAMRVLHPADRGAVADWIKGCGDLELGAQVLNSLAQMARGEGWVWSPEIGFGPERVKFPLFKTYDSFRPQTAEDAAALKGWATVDLDDVKAKLAKVVQEAEASDPSKLKAQIAQLRAELAKKPAAAPVVDQVAIAAARQEGREEGARDGYAAGLRAMSPYMDRMATLTGALQEHVDGFHADLKKLSAQAVLQVYARRNTKPPKPLTRQALQRTPAGSAEAGLNGALPKVERAFLTVLAQQARPLTRNQVAIFAGYSATSRHVDNTLAALRSKAYVEGGGDAIAITPGGIAALGNYQPLPTGADLRDYWQRELDKAASAFLGVICDAYPGTLTRDEVAERAGYSPQSRHVDNTLAQLRSRHLVTGNGKAIKASMELFDA